MEKNFDELGITLQEMSTPGVMYILVKQLDNALLVSGQVPFVNGVMECFGCAGDSITLREALKVARFAV